MGGAPAVLGRRAALLAALAAALAAYLAVDSRLWEAGTWWDIAWIALVLIPATFGLVWLALPLWRLPVQALLALAAGFGLLAVGCGLASLDIAGNFAKLAAMTFVAWAFLSLFEALAWVVIVAAIIPFVDSYSVWRGPTKHIVESRQDVFATLSIAFPAPGSGGAAHLGLPDVLFFALFLGSAVRFGLRPGWTWLAMTVSIGLTMTLAVAFDVNGLPALPLISLGFLLPNADLFWRRLRAGRLS